MRPGERLRLMTDASESLAPRLWGEASAICREFGFQVWEPNDEPDRGWWMQALQQSEDGDLTGLHAFLTGEDAAPQPSGKWASAPLFVFLSHLHQHREFTARLQRQLRSYGIESFVAHNDIEPSKTWRDEIKSGLASCHAFVALLHNGFHQSQWCDQEVGWALGRRVPIIPVRPPGGERRDGFLGDYQDVILTKEDEFFLSRQIFMSLFHDPRTHEAGVRCLAEGFVNSWSFDTTRWFWELIAAEPHFESEQLRRLEYAVATNNQVFNAVYGPQGEPIPELVAALVKRHEPPPPENTRPAVDEPPF